MKKRKSFKSLAEELRKIRRRPVPLQQIEEFNRIIEGDPNPKEERSTPKKRIAQPPEANN
jgi:hypothetical protein